MLTIVYSMVYKCIFNLIKTEADAAVLETKTWQPKCKLYDVCLLVDWYV